MKKREQKLPLEKQNKDIIFRIIKQRDHCYLWKNKVKKIVRQVLCCWWQCGVCSLVITADLSYDNS